MLKPRMVSKQEENYERLQLILDFCLALKMGSDTFWSSPALGLSLAKGEGVILLRFPVETELLGRFMRQQAASQPESKQCNECLLSQI